MTDDIDAYREYIEAALEYSGGTHTFEDVKSGVARGDMQFWPGKASAVITEIVVTPQVKVLNYFLAGGNLPELEIMAPIIESWGRSQGCTKVTLVGRKGWERTFLTRTGYKPTLVVYEKSLGE